MIEQLVSHEIPKLDPLEELQKHVNDAFNNRAILSEKKQSNEKESDTFSYVDKLSSKESSSRSELMVENVYMYAQLVAKGIEKIYPQKTFEEKRQIVSRILANEFLHHTPHFDKDTKFTYCLQFIEDLDNKAYGFRTFTHSDGEKQREDFQQLILVPFHKSETKSSLN